MQRIGLPNTIDRRNSPTSNLRRTNNPDGTANSSTHSPGTGATSGSADLNHTQTTGEMLSNQQTAADSILNSPSQHDLFATSPTTAEQLSQAGDRTIPITAGATALGQNYETTTVALAEPPDQSLLQDPLFNQSPFNPPTLAPLTSEAASSDTSGDTLETTQEPPPPFSGEQTIDQGWLDQRNQ